MKSATDESIFNLFNLIRVVVIGGLLVGMSFIPMRHAPSVAEWVQAYVRGNGKPHFPVTGTPARRIEDLYDRFPELRPEWDEVTDEENGYLQLRTFVESEAATQLALTDGLSAMLQDSGKWNQEAALGHIEKSKEALKELRRIALMPDRSAKEKSAKDLLNGEPYQKMADALLLSFQRHLHAKRFSDAFPDFAALYGFAAHLDGHEIPNMVDKTLAIQIRLAPHDALSRALKDAPEGTDWSPWIRILDNQPSYSKQMEAVWRGEAWYELRTHPVWKRIKQNKNPIWDFAEFEDAYATRMQTTAKAYSNTTKLTDLKNLNKLDQEFTRQEPMLSKAARIMLDVSEVGSTTWCRTAIRAEARYNLTLTALQLLKSEYEEGPITSAQDMRLGSFAIDPSNGQPFAFDPAKRQLSEADGSALAGEDPLQLPDW